MKKPDAKRMIAVDWGASRIGLAASDPSGMIAKPICIIEHVSRQADAETIIAKCGEIGAELILVGVSYDDENNPTPSGRSASRLAEEIKKISSFDVILQDEGFTTNDAQDLMIKIGKRRKNRKGHLDDIAAAVMLQNYLDMKKK